MTPSEIQNGIPNRPTLDDVFARWNERHKDRFGTYVNLATAGQENYDRQIKELTQETQTQQSAWDKKYGNTSEGQVIAQNPPPNWEDIYKTWAQDYKRVFGTDVLDRPWNADADAIRQKEELDNRYLDALNSYNKTFGVNVLPDEGVLGSNVQPNAFYKEPEKKSGGLGGFLASIDPSRAIGKGLAEVDTTVNREIPGGWALPAIIAAAVATGYVDPSLLAAEAGAAGTAGAASGSALTAAEAASLLEAAALAEGGTTAGMVAAANTGLPAGTITLGGAGTAGLTASNAAPIFDFSTEAMLTPGGNVVPATTLPTEMAGIDAEIARAGANAQSLTAREALSTANRARSLAGLLSGGQTNQTGMQMTNMQTPQFEQFGGLYRGNQTPFLVSQTPQIQPLQQTQNFLAELSEQGKTNDLATLLRNI